VGSTVGPAKTENIPIQGRRFGHRPWNHGRRDRGDVYDLAVPGMSIQWLGTQKAVFIWAGLMHPLCLIIYRLWIGRDFKPIDVDKPLNMFRRRGGLLAGGVVLSILGLALALMIYWDWEVCVAAAKITGAAHS